MRGCVVGLSFLVLALPAPAETLAEIGARLGRETQAAYDACPYIALARNHFSRFSPDPAVRPAKNETEITPEWQIACDDDPLVRRMAEHLREFLTVMGRDIAIVDAKGAAARAVLALRIEAHPGAPVGSYRIRVTRSRAEVIGQDAAGVRDGVVKLVDEMGFRAAAILPRGEQTYTPRLSVRLGVVPYGGSYRDLVFQGYNAISVGGGSLFALSTSDAIPELAARRVPGALEAGAKATRAAREYGLKTYAWLDIRQKFPKDDPVLAAHPEIRGALTWREDGEYVLCTEHPLVQRWLEESIEGLFKADPGLDGIVLIIGGEGFYHCYMRPFGVKKGRSNCPRCDALGAERTVANLCNRLAHAARRVNPHAEAVVWPYSAEHVWSADKTQAGLISLLEPGVALLTEIEKDEYVEKPGGVRKHLWDYSIDLIGPGERARAQIAACKAAGIPVYLKSEPELAFEAPRLPQIPCMDRWWLRGDALAGCGASGAWVFPAFRSNFGTSAAEINKHTWWEPVAPMETTLGRLAARIAGPAAGPLLREAWRKVSEAIPFSPELPSYYTGPYYLGPCQPMIANPEAPVPEVFTGYYLFMAEIMDAEGLKRRPVYYTQPTGNVPVFTAMYREMERLLGEAVRAMDTARPQVPERCRMPFDAEDSPIQWFYRTARTEANFYDSCQLRDALLALARQAAISEAERAEAREKMRRWRALLDDEYENTRAALPIMEADPRLDMRYGGDHTFSHGADMLRAKLDLLDAERSAFLPALANTLGIPPAP
jgi:hypothetical protein